MVSEFLIRLHKGELPQHAQEALVKGILPVESEELITAIYLICTRQEQHLDQARDTFEGLPDGVKKTYFENRDLDAEILDFYLRHFSIPTEAKSAILLNPNTMGSSIEAAAADLESQLLDLAVNNQVKIQDEPGIVEALRLNPGLSITQKQKLDEYERLLLRSKIAPAEELEDRDTDEIIQEAIDDAREFVQTFGKESGPFKMASSVVDSGPSAEPVSDDQQAEPTSPKQKLSVLEQLQSMSVPQKIQAAIKGDREVRGILIRDSNKQVCTAVVKSPRITDAEVEFYANLRNVQTDVLRLIAANREWTKSYKVIHNLIKNPRTPIAQTTRLIHRLNKRDIRNLQRDRGIPEALRTMARKLGR
jgi:hypothetical protein